MHVCDFLKLAVIKFDSRDSMMGNEVGRSRGFEVIWSDIAVERYIFF